MQHMHGSRGVRGELVHLAAPSTLASAPESKLSIVGLQGKSGSRQKSGTEVSQKGAKAARSEAAPTL